MSKTDELLSEILDELKKLNSKIEALEERFSKMIPKVNINPMDIFKNFMNSESEE